MSQITLPDGSVRSFDHPVTVFEVAQSIGTGLARAALAGRVDGKLVDTSYPIENNANLAIITDKDADGVEIIRHSTAHLMAYAVQELFPDAQVTIGPAIEDGFYYDFAYKRPFTLDDLAAIEKKMTELAKQDIPIERFELSRNDAVKFFLDLGEKYKAEIIQSIPENEVLSLYPSFLFSQHSEEILQNIRNSLNKDDFYRSEIYGRSKKGEIIPAIVTINAIRDDKGEISNYMIMFMEIYGIKEREEKLQKIAHYDALTNLPNRIYFM